MDDRQAIVDLTVEYCFALDDRSWDDLHAVFTSDVHVDYGFAVCDGIPEVIEAVSAIIEPLDATTHSVTNHRVRTDGDRATCSCYLLAQHRRAGTPGGELYLIAARYHDELVRTEAGWRIADRRLERLWKDGNPAVVHGQDR